jgi:hypothetical protein
MYEDDDIEYTTWTFWWSGGEFGYGLAPGTIRAATETWAAILWMIGELGVSSPQKSVDTLSLK